MTDVYCNYQIAEGLKALGYNEPCCTYYENGVFQDPLVQYPRYNQETHIVNFVSAPTHAAARRWLREVKGVEIAITPCIDLFIPQTVEKYVATIQASSPNDWVDYHAEGKTYEEAEEKALLLAIQELKRKNNEKEQP